MSTGCISATQGISPWTKYKS